ncbi:MAG: ATP-dependent Clp protease, protease subunit [Bacteroidota bacterium]|jgi:ATP-dependent Clp protease protease subunit|nr:ATP-dependent Clp protease, protease subunit [Bacteroidota bacterium]
MNTDQIIQAALQKRCIAVSDDISEKQMDTLRTQIMMLKIMDPKREIFILIDSNGGEIFATLKLIDFMKSMDLNFTGIVNGKCKSAALLILASCNKKHSLTHSVFFFHEVRVSISINTFMDLNSKFEQEKKEFGMLMDDVTKIYQNGFRISKEKIMELMYNGYAYRTHLGAVEAKELGIIDEIITSLPL